MNVILIGGSGLLGKELIKIYSNIVCPTHDQLDITKDFNLHNVDIVINAAAVKDNRTIELDPREAIRTNVIGAANVAIKCYNDNIRYVYISTDYCYKGDRGNYREDDPIFPANIYAWLKVGGESTARTVKNHLIIRTSFGPQKFEYSIAFTDKWTSKDYVSVIAPMIMEAALSPLTGVLNIGTERKTLYDHAAKLNRVKGVRLGDSSFTTPYDTSFNLQKWMDYKSSKPLARPHTNCRVCGSEKLTKYLDLGLMPLANNLEFTCIRAKQADRFPLQIMFCEDCGLSQLSVVIDPEKMYSYYTYRSGVNKPYEDHCKIMAYSVLNNFGEPEFHIDIAGNDGTLLKSFKDTYYKNDPDYRYRPEYNCLNVDPASNLTAISEANGIPAVNAFWSIETAIAIRTMRGEADLITATNVFAHVDDIKDFLGACKHGLKDEGILIIECPYIIDFIENMEFDTTYFEHLSYMSLMPMQKLCSALGLKIIEVEKQHIHGGTIRVTIAKEASTHEVQPEVIEFFQNEFDCGFNQIEVYRKWSDLVKDTIKQFSSQVLALKKEGNKIACFAASAKGNTLLNACNLSTDIIDYIVDQTPEKIGKYSPGTGIPIVNISELAKNPPDYVIILAWNFADVIIPKIQKECNAKIIIPIPKFVVI
jgi:dTDP-4-dehydrorhamnose reductase